MTDERSLSEAQARRLWQRAAELQADAARTLEERSEGLARRGTPEGEVQEGFSLTHVRQAALEAGISAEFVDMAVQELGEDVEAEGGFVRRVIGEGPRWLTASRTYPRSAAEVLASMQRVLPRLRLTLVDTVDGEPLDGGWMHFEMPTVGLGETERVMSDLYQWADVRELHFRLESLGDDSSRLTVRAPLGYSRRLGGRIFGILAPVGGLFAGLVTGAIASGIVGGLGLTPLAEVLAVWGPVTGAFALGTGGGLKGLRKLSRVGWRKGQSAVERLLGSIDMDARMGGAFQPAPPPPSRGLGLDSLLEG